MSVYAMTIPCFAQMLRSLSTLLSKGEERAQALGFEVQHLLDARLAPDMHTLICLPMRANHNDSYV